MPRLWFDARLLSVASFASDCGVQAESIVHADAAVHRLWIGRPHQERDHRQAAAASFHSFDLSLGLAGAADLLLDISEHTLVSVRVMNPQSFDPPPLDQFNFTHVKITK
jgi:hypothetical protein